MAEDYRWAWPGNARKAHAFAGGRSLCGRWIFLGRQDQSQNMGEEPGRFDCVTCFRKMKKKIEETP